MDPATKVETAARYLNENAELKDALGIAATDTLVPKPLGHGEHNENYVFPNPTTGEKHVLRINVVSQPFHDNQVAYEYAALKALETSECTPIAQYVDYSKKLIPNGVLVISFCEGQELDFDNLRPGDLQCVAQLLANVHSVPVQDDCELFRPKDPLQELYEESLRRIDLYRGCPSEDKRILNWVDHFIAKCAPAVSVSRDIHAQAHIVNTEALPSHFMIPENPAGPNLPMEHPGFFIDWERPVIGEVAQDVAYFANPTTTIWDSNLCFPKSQIQSFVDDYWKAVDGRFAREDFDRRFWAYSMVTALHSLSWCCRAIYRLDKDSSSYITDKALEKMKIYFSEEFLQMIDEECFGEEL